MSRKGNILLVANWESDVGYAWWLMENFWISIANHFSRKKINSHLIYPRINSIPESIANSCISISECDFRNHTYENLKKLHSIIKNNNIRFIYLSDSPAFSLFYLLLRAWGVRVIVIHDHTPGERTPARSWRKLLKSTMQSIPLLTADHFIAVTDFVYRRFIDVACIPAGKCSVAPNGIHPLDLDNADPLYAQNVFHIPQDRLIIVTTGRATYYKGIDFFIRCAEELIKHRNLKNLHFLYCGDGPDIDNFKSLVCDLGLTDNFTFTGKRADVRDMLPSCHIGFHASKGEVGYSLSILEYMSAGLATIVPDRKSTREATIHGETGLVYIHDSICDAVEAIISCMSSDYRNSLSSKAIESVAGKYNINLTNQKLISSLEKIINI